MDIDDSKSNYLNQLRSPVLALCLSARRNLCIHPEVSKEDDRIKVDSLCRSLTASWVREKSIFQNGRSDQRMIGDIEETG